MPKLSGENVSRMEYLFFWLTYLGFPNAAWFFMRFSKNATFASSSFWTFAAMVLTQFPIKNLQLIELYKKREIWWTFSSKTDIFTNKNNENPLKMIQYEQMTNVVIELQFANGTALAQTVCRVSVWVWVQCSSREKNSTKHTTKRCHDMHESSIWF